MFDQKWFANLLQKLVPIWVKVSVRGWSDDSYGGREAVTVLNTKADEDEQLCTILPMPSPYGMYIACTVPAVLDRLGISLTTDPRPDGKSVLKVGNTVFLLSTRKQGPNLYWEVNAELTDPN